jgi:FkbM family methyltransferase
MKRTPSALAQSAFSVTTKLQYLANHASFPVRQFARAANKLVAPVSKRLGTNHIVSAHVYGHDLLMPAEHPLAGTIAIYPQYNRPLALAAQAIAECSQTAQVLTAIDVGANIGETVALIQQSWGRNGWYLCIEPDPDISELCRLNHRGNDRVEVQRYFIGEDAGATVWLQDDGRANPSTKFRANDCESADTDRLSRLDTVAASFAERHGTLSLIKVDTEGFDFAVLRSASALLTRYGPALYFEWFPELLSGLGEETWAGLEYLASMGYRHFVFFTNRGDYYCSVDDPDRVFIRSMAAITVRDSTGYFDVFAATDKAVCQKLVELSALNERNADDLPRPRNPAPEFARRIR